MHVDPKTPIHPASARLSAILNTLISIGVLASTIVADKTNLFPQSPWIIPATYSISALAIVISLLGIMASFIPQKITGYIFMSSLLTILLIEFCGVIASAVLKGLKILPMLNVDLLCHDETCIMYVKGLTYTISGLVSLGLAFMSLEVGICINSIRIWRNKQAADLDLTSPMLFQEDES